MGPPQGRVGGEENLPAQDASRLRKLRAWGGSRSWALLSVIAIPSLSHRCGAGTLPQHLL